MAIALRNRWRRQNVPDEIREEIMPNNIIMIGPTGVGKTEIARRLARLAGAPFIKVEASKFTEVGYVGRDVESIIRELAELRVSAWSAPNARTRWRRRPAALPRSGSSTCCCRRCRASAVPAGEQATCGMPAQLAEVEAMVEEEGEVVPIAPGEPPKVGERRPGAGPFPPRPHPRKTARATWPMASWRSAKWRSSSPAGGCPWPICSAPAGMEDTDINLAEMLEEMMPRKRKKREVTVAEARRILLQEEIQKLIDIEDVIGEAIERVEETGIVFLDEIDKIVGPSPRPAARMSPARGSSATFCRLSRAPMCRPNIGLVRTDHILFIAAGAFHATKPSDLIPELQGRFPIRVELPPSSEKDFVPDPDRAQERPDPAVHRTDPHRGRGSRCSQDEAIREMAEIAWQLNQKLENIGARRLHTVMFALMEDLLFDLPDVAIKQVTINRQTVPSGWRSCPRTRTCATISSRLNPRPSRPGRRFCPRTHLKAMERSS